VVVLAIETSPREATTMQDSATLHVQDAKDRASLAEREALEWVSKAEMENATVLASAHEDAEGLAQTVTLLEDELVVECRAW
jgi:NADPH-dependent ferric siderophore reductase